MDPDYEQRLFRQVNGQRTPTKNSPAVSLINAVHFLKKKSVAALLKIPKFFCVQA